MGRDIREFLNNKLNWYCFPKLIKHDLTNYKSNNSGVVISQSQSLSIILRKDAVRYQINDSIYPCAPLANIKNYHCTIGYQNIYSHKIYIIMAVWKRQDFLT